MDGGPDDRESDQEATLQDMLQATDERLVDRCCTVLSLEFTAVGPTPY